ncbi:MAG: hypothetical protein IJ593_12415 [Lachnospiraceae bacterium]|nr:hypothetical protein [Lachnospiraceae bacterium]
MIYNFDDITNDEIYKNCRVMVVTGKYNLFNNIVVDKLKESSYNKGLIPLDNELIAEFGLDTSDTYKISNSVDLVSFTQLCRTPSISGKWFCSVDIGSIPKKYSDWVKAYIKDPSEDAILVLTSVKYGDYKNYLNNPILKSSKQCNLIQLSFPRFATLKQVVTNLFLERNARLEPNALELFVIRMSNAYDDYDVIINKVCDENLPEGYLNKTAIELPVITYEQMFDSLRGIENFVIDDFIEQLTNPLISENPRAGSMVFKMMGYLVKENGARKLASILRNKIDELIDFRVAINSGYIPILVNYDVDECKKLIGEDENISKKSEYQFRKLAKIASRTTLQDWVYMKMILANSNIMDDKSFERVIYSLTARTRLTESRLNNDIGINNIMYSDIDYLNGLAYNDFDETKYVETRKEYWKGEQQ